MKLCLIPQVIPEKTRSHSLEEGSHYSDRIPHIEEQQTQSLVPEKDQGTETLITFPG